MPYLEKLAHDITHQTRPFDQVLMYDDASQDETAATAESMGFTVLRGVTNRRPAWARNQLLQQAGCDFVHFHDSDDPIHPRFVEGMLPFAQEGAILVCSFSETQRDGRKGSYPVDQKFETAPFDLVFSAYAHLNAIVFCRKLALRSGGLDEGLTLSEEKDFLYKVISAGARVIIHREELAEWVHRPDSLMYSQDYIRGAAMLRRFIHNCLASPQPAAKRGMLDYCLREAWNFYHADPTTLPQIAMMCRELRNSGYWLKTGLGRKMEIMCSILGPVGALKLRRAMVGKKADQFSRVRD